MPARILLYLIFSFSIIFILLFACNLVETSDSQKTADDSAHNSLFSTPPDSLPVLFAPGFISTNLNERDAAFSPDSKVFYFTLWTGKFGVIVFTQKTADGWTELQVAPFSGQYSDLEPFVTYDGQRLYFASNRPLSGNGASKDYDIWYVDRTESGWSEPVNIGSPVNTEKNEFYPTLTKDGTLYLTGRYENSLGGEDIFFATFKDGEFGRPENLGEGVNSKHDEFNSFIAPDASYIIFSSYGREDDRGGGDLYISFRKTDASWTTAKNLGDKINSPVLDYCPSVSPDGKYFFFTSQKSKIASYAEIRRDFATLIRDLNAPQNGLGDIYWLPSDFINRMQF